MSVVIVLYLMYKLVTLIERSKLFLERTFKRKSTHKDVFIQPLLGDIQISCPTMTESHHFEDQYLFLLERYRMTEIELTNASCKNKYCDKITNKVMCIDCTEAYCDRCIYEWKTGSPVYAVFENILISNNHPFCCIFCFINK